MQWLRITHLTIGSLAFAIVASLLVFYLLRPRNKSKPTLLLAGYVGSTTIMSLSYVVCYSVLAPSAAEYYSFAQAIILGVALLPFFAYSFPRNIHPRASKVVSYGYLVLAAGAFVADFFTSRKTLSYEPLSQRFTYTTSLPFTLLLGLGFVLSIAILARKTVLLSGYNGRFASWAQKPQRLVSRAGLRSLASHVVIPAAKLIRPIGKEARSARAFAAITATSFAISLSFVLQFLRLISAVTFAEAFNIGGLVIVLAYFVTYTNVSPEFTSFRQKLVGVSIGTVMVFLGLAGTILFSYLDTSYDREILGQGRSAVASIVRGDSLPLPPSISYVVSRPATGDSAVYTMLAATEKGIAPADFARSDQISIEAESRRGNLKATSQVRGFRFFDVRDPSSFFLRYDFIVAGTLYEVGSRYRLYRDVVHQLGMRIAVIILMAAALILLLFPRFFRASITMPLDELRRGVKEVDGGNLDMHVPAFAADEIGYLANAFNRMVGNIKAISIENSRNYQQVQDLNLGLEEKIRERTVELESKNRQVMDSIHYARTIQRSILPDERQIARVCPRHFVIWEPRDVVGGDFYYFCRHEAGYLLGVADCTGHGVPGAFMTMLAKSVLDRITADVCQDDPARILRELNLMVRATLNRGRSRSDDGLDVGLCNVRSRDGVVVYAGAKLSLYYCRAGAVHEVKGQGQGIGYRESDEGFPYVNQEVAADSDTTYYLVTDGFYDQSGGERGHPFGRRRTEELWVGSHGRPMGDQKTLITETLHGYQGKLPQRDDITVLGFAVEGSET